MARQIRDDAFHEIQLNGKQLVFLFMAATVVSVVIFLCGVLVGRGVRTERGGSATDATGLVPVAPRDVFAPSPHAAPAGVDPTAAGSPPTVDELSYFSRLETPNQPAEDLKPAASRPSDEEKSAERTTSEETRTTPAAASPQTPPATEPPAKAPSQPLPAEEAALGFTVQVVALNVRSEADAIASRLNSKGYPAYVVPPANGALIYRVRVGKFKTRREAEPVAAKLQEEEQFKPWITR